MIFSIEAPGGGRSSEATEPQAFWRNFAALDFIGGDGADVLRFVQRHGDPFGTVVAGSRTFDTLNWIPVAAELKKVAQAWEPPDKDGVSKPTCEVSRLHLATNNLRRALSDVTDAFTVITDKTGLELVRRADTLHAFMVASAASAFRRRIAMRQCAYEGCRDWFEARRRDARFCSDSCRASYAVTQKEK
jgi:hypothetical protein